MLQCLSAQDWIALLAAGGVFVGTVSTAAVKIINAVRENTAETRLNTAVHVNAAEGDAPPAAR